MQPWEVDVIRRWSPDVRAYDIIYNSSCDAATDDDRLLLIYRLTHKDDLK